MPRGIAKNPKEKSRRISEARKGMKFSKEHKRKLSIAKKGIRNPMKKLNNRVKISKAQLKLVREGRHIFWKGGVTQILSVVG